MARARSFGNIRQRPSGRYQACYWHLGKQVAADSTFANKTDARRWLSTVEADMVRGVWVDPDAGKTPFGEYAERWVAERPVRPRTREIYENQLRRVVAVSPTSTCATCARSTCGRGTVDSHPAAYTPCAAADGLVLWERHQTTFVNLLRTAIRHGGFLGFDAHDGEPKTPIPDELAALARSLEPI